MRASSRRRAVFCGITIVLGLVASNAAPASAVARDATFWGHGPPVVTGLSTIDIGGNIGWTIPDTGGVCGTGEPSSIRLDIDNPANGQIQVPMANFVMAPSTVVVNMVNYQVQVVAQADTTGTITVDPDGAIAWDLSVRFVFRSCNGASVVCTSTTTTATLSGFYSGTAAGGTRAGAAIVSGVSTSLSTLIGCNATIRAAIQSQTAVFDFYMDV